MTLLEEQTVAAQLQTAPAPGTQGTQAQTPSLPSVVGTGGQQPDDACLGRGGLAEAPDPAELVRGALMSLCVQVQVQV